jgi:hypothetical protein
VCTRCPIGIGFGVFRRGPVNASRPDIYDCDRAFVGAASAATASKRMPRLTPLPQEAVAAFRREHRVRLWRTYPDVVVRWKMASARKQTRQHIFDQTFSATARVFDRRERHRCEQVAFDQMLHRFRFRRRIGEFRAVAGRFGQTHL